MGKGKRYKKKKKNKLFIFLILWASILVAIILFKNNKNEILTNYNHIKENIAEITKEETSTSEERIKKLKELQNENPDVMAWIEIEDTNINYPVVQTKNNDYYMYRNYKREKSKDGSLFIDKDYDWKLPSTNILIYGHNNRGSSEMFASLMNYKEEQFYKEHNKIRFTTVEEDAEYEIIAVFLSRVYYKSEKDVFRYYYFINAENEEEFNEYVNNSKKESLYNIEATAKYGDQLLTLSTCSYHTEDGRLAVVARKIK